MNILYVKAAILALAVVCGGRAVAAAPAAQATPETTIRLVSAMAGVQPGSAVDLAIEQTLAPGWHTYWRNPGDSGEAMSIDWKLPAGVRADAVSWPVPERFATGPVMTYGYKDKVTFLTRVSVPGDWPVGRPVEIAANIYVLVCSEICIPAEASLALTVPTADKASPSEAAAPVFARARRQLPDKCPWTPSIRPGRGGLTLSLAGAENAFQGVESAYFFAETWGVVKHAGVQNVTVTDRALVLDLPGGQVPFGGALSGVVALHALPGVTLDPDACRLEAKMLGQ